MGRGEVLRGNWECSKHVEEIPKYQRTGHRSGVAAMFPFDKKQAAKKIRRDTEREVEKEGERKEEGERGVGELHELGSKSLS